MIRRFRTWIGRGVGGGVAVAAVLLVAAVAPASEKHGTPQGGERKPAAPPSGDKQAAPHAAEEERPWVLIDADRAQKWLNRQNVRVLDVRSPEAYKKGHLPNAISLPFESLSDPQSRIHGRRKDDRTIAETFGRLGIGRDSWVVIYDDRGGHLAARIYWLFDYFGHQRVWVLDGGIDKWVAQKRPLVQGTVKFGVQIFPIDLTPRRLATADWILDRMRDPELVLIDVREPKGFQRGHIPGAINIPWDSTLREDKTWKPGEQLRKMFEGAKVTPDKNVVVYCDFGDMNAHVYVTLKLLGYARVRSYELAFAEWAMDPTLPVKGSRVIVPHGH